jgi:hypothetical protein
MDTQLYGKSCQELVNEQAAAATVRLLKQTAAALQLAARANSSFPKRCYHMQRQQTAASSQFTARTRRNLNARIGNIGRATKKEKVASVRT